MGMGHWKLVSFVIFTAVNFVMLFNVHPALAESPTLGNEITGILYPILGAMPVLSNYLILLTFTIVGAGSFAVLYFSCKIRNSKNLNSISNQ